MEIKPGKYHAKVVDYGITSSKAGDPMMTVRFAWTDEGVEQQYNWIGSFKEGKAQEITVKTLIVLGLKSTDKIPELADGPSSNALDLTKVVEISIENETYEGKTSPRIKWVNEIGIRNAMAKDDFKSKIQSLGVKGTFTALFSGQKVQPKSEKQVIDDIPF